MSNSEKKAYSIRYVTTPAPSPKKVKAPRQNGKDALNANDPFARPIHEDDDGYDPYSDRQPKESLFESNPWD